jgi:hypothetical protein
MKILEKKCTAIGAEALASVAASAQNSTGRSRRTLTKVFCCASLLLVVCALPALAADDPLLSRLEGEWIGQGTVQKGPAAEPERIYCKIANKLVDGGSALEQKGRCAVASNSGRLRGKIAAKGQGRFEGSLDSPQTDGPAVLAGHAQNDKIVLSARFVDRFSKRPSNSTISLFVGDGGAYRLVSDTLNPGTGERFQASNILFKQDKKR